MVVGVRFVLVAAVWLDWRTSKSSWICQACSNWMDSQEFVCGLAMVC